MVQLSHKAQALLVSFGAGAATAVGASLCLCTSALNRRVLAGTMAFSAGVMIYVSLGEVLGEATSYFARDSFDEQTAYKLATASLFAGVILMALVDAIVHCMLDHTSHSDDKPMAAASPSSHRQRVHGIGASPSDPSFARLSTDAEDSCHNHEHEHEHEDHDHGAASIRAVASIEDRRKMLTMATVVSAAIVLHNVPEGAATYVASFVSANRGFKHPAIR